MNYELALKLKNARFPQGMYPNSQYYISPNIIIERKDIFQDLYHDNPKEARTSNEFVYKPTLEDLIEAIGSHYHEMQDVQVWKVAKDGKESTHVDATVAYANLYLKLHE